MAKNQNTRDVKRDGKRSGGGGKTAVAVAVAALLLGGGGYYGLSGDGMGVLPDHQGLDPFSPQVSTEATQPEVTTEAPTENDQKQDSVIEITVSEGKIIYEGAEIELVAFEDAILKDYKEGMSITLKDDHAVKASYDEIKTVLDKLGYKYTEE